MVSTRDRQSVFEHMTLQKAPQRTKSVIKIQTNKRNYIHTHSLTIIHFVWLSKECLVIKRERESEKGGVILLTNSCNYKYHSHTQGSPTHVSNTVTPPILYKTKGEYGLSMSKKSITIVNSSIAVIKPTKQWLHLQSEHFIVASHFLL